MSERHFHEASICLACLDKRWFSTPIMDILVMSSQCRSCSMFVSVGLVDDNICPDCRGQLAAFMAAR